MDIMTANTKVNTFATFSCVFCVQNKHIAAKATVASNSSTNTTTKFTEYGYAYCKPPAITRRTVDGLK